jgi:hypothetical protein
MRGFNIFRFYQTVSRSKELRGRYQFYVMTIDSCGGSYIFLEEYGSRLAGRFRTAKRGVLGLMGK